MSDARYCSLRCNELDRFPQRCPVPADLLVQALLEGLVLQIWRQSSSAEVRQGH